MVDDGLSRTEGDLTGLIATDLDAAGFDDAVEIGRGGFGVVFRCEQPALDRTVAVKVLTADLEAEHLERFLREQRAMGKLSGHPNIVSILFSGVLTAGRPYIVMPFHPRKSLQDSIERDGPLPWGEALRVGVKIAGALEAAHRREVLHRDVKPGNILTTEYGEPELTDFGIAHVSGGFVTSTGVITGSPAFTAPEVLRGRAPTVASDVYSLGATLFCLMTGHAAFERRVGEKVVTQFLRIMSEPVPDLRERDIPDELCRAIERAMSEHPPERYPSAQALGSRLAEIQQLHGLVSDRMNLPVETGDEPDDPRPSRSATPQVETRRAQSAPPAALTKFRPPVPSRSLVMRDRLIEALRAGRRRRLTVIHAPAGFGKSTLTAQWRSRLVADGVPVAWISVDRDDNNAVWFLAHLAQALGQALPSLAEPLSRILDLHGDSAEPYVLTTLINEIHHGGEDVVLVIDDWHRVVDHRAVAVLGYLLERGCHHLRIVVNSRDCTGLPLSAMRVHDELVDIGADTLRFTPSEARLFFEGAGGLALDPADITQLTESTDGWVAAMQLAALSLRDCEEPRKLIGRISGSDRAIANFLAENVLDGLEPRVRTFILRTSITERLSADLACALSGTGDGAAMLAEVQARDLFLGRDDSAPGWVRYHHMFADFLRQRLAREHPEQITDLHRSASRWFADHDLLSEAVDHAVAAGDQARAVELVENGGVRLLEQSRMAILPGLIAKLPPETVQSSLRLQITTAWAGLLLQHREQAETAMGQVRSLLAAQPLRSVALEAEAQVLDAAVRVTADRIDGVSELLEPCSARPESLHPWVVTAAADMAMFVAIQHFDYAEAHRIEQWAATYHRRTSGPFSVMYGHCFDGVAFNEQLDVEKAERSFRTAVQVTRRGGRTHSHSARIAGALLGDLLFDLGEIDEAERLLDEGYVLGGEGGVVDSMAATYGTGARVKAIRGDLDTARQRLLDGLRLAKELSLPRLTAYLVDDSFVAGIPLPDTSPSSKPVPLDGADGIALRTAELEEEAAIRGLLSRGSITASEQARVRSTALVEHIESMPRPRAALRVGLLLAVSCIASGERDEAEQILLVAVRRCAELGLVGLLRFGDPSARDLLRGMVDAPGHASSLPRAFVSEVLAPL
ncbi:MULTISPECIES: serine/threonine-protein kinase [Nocardia]|uniref:serine/threonine-protein kinase n=1 Tax=Nocardia TaxID=1817 RepID=UPI000D68BA50|nr:MULTISPECIES: serine/threonine-protein kinase [Nocardia]